MSAYRILIVDDEPGIRFILERTLSREGYILDNAASGREALDKLEQDRYDLMLLDLRLGDMDGLQVLRSIRERDPELVVLILTGYGTMESSVEALRLGAFDYLFKPAPPDMIRERVREGLAQREKSNQRQALLAQIETLRQAISELEAASEQQTPPKNDARFLRSGKLVIDRFHRIATLDGNLLDLTTTEYELLLSLASASPAPVSPRQLLKTAMGYDAEDIEAREIVKWHIHHLRRKIEPDSANPRYIKNIRYKGYMWSGE
jgi:DNA-binding response OmpR family regulator